MTLKIGQKAPTFTLPTPNGPFSLENHLGRPVIVYFYPKDDTPGCTTQACHLRDSFESFQNSKAIIIGISRDSLESHQAFAQKYHLPFYLGSDTQSQVSHEYGVLKEKRMFGKPWKGIERTTFLLNTDHIITHIWRNVNVQEHLSQVLKALETI